MRRAFTFDNLVITLGILAIGFLLVNRFLVSMTRYFNPDEFLHLYRAYLLSAGKIPYKDFGYQFSPVFAALLSPFLFFFKEEITAIFLARSFNFSIFLLILFVIYFIARLSFNSKTAILAAFFWGFFPMAFANTIEIRPDHLAIFFWLLSFLFLLLAEKKRDSKFILGAGFFFGLSVVVLLKTIFGYLGLMICLLVIYRNSWSRFFWSFLLFHFGFVIPWLVLGLVFSYLGILDKGIYSIFIMSWELAHAYPKELFFYPLFPFYPNAVLFGEEGKSLPWFLSNLIFLLGIAGLIKGLIKIIFGRDCHLTRLFLFFSFLGFTGATMFVYSFTFSQYYLPQVVIISLAAADLWLSFEKKILRKSRMFLLTSWVLLLSILSFGYWRMIQANLAWRNDAEIALVKTILAISKPGDHVFDMTGHHLFREQGYFLCCELFGEFRSYLSRSLPDFQAELKRTQTKFVIQSWRLETLSKSEQVFVDDNYLSSGVGNILVVGKRIVFSNDSPTKFELLASGNYRINKKDGETILIDEKRVNMDRIYLNNGWHTGRGIGVKELLLFYDY